MIDFINFLSVRKLQRSCAAFLHRTVTASSAKRKELASLRQLFVRDADFSQQPPGYETNARKRTPVNWDASISDHCRIPRGISFRARYPSDTGGVKNRMLFERSEFHPV